MATNWKEFRESLDLTPEEEKMISHEKTLINAIVDKWEKDDFWRNNDGWPLPDCGRNA